MRILYISDINAVHTQRWASAMLERGHEVVVLSVRSGALDGVKVIFCDPGDLPAPIWIRILRHIKFLLLDLNKLFFE